MERLKTNRVPPAGPLTAQIAFIGEAPGREEDEHLMPFVGPAGRVLDQCLRIVGLLRNEILFLNVFDQRPPGNDVGYFFQDSRKSKLTWEGEEHVRRLKSLLEELLQNRKRGTGGPNVLVALGDTAMFFLTGKRGITKWRGSVLPCSLVEGFKVYVTYHPSFVMRLMNEKEERLTLGDKKDIQNVLPLFLKDLERAEIQGKSPELKLPERSFSINCSFSELLALLDSTLRETLVSVDIETLRSENGPLIWCVGFSPSPERAFVVPFIRNGKLCWSLEEEKILWHRISEIFLSPSVKKVFHNCLYDLSVLGRYYGLRVEPSSLEDTMFCYQATYPYLRKGLDVLTSIFTWEPYYKDDGKVWDGRRISDEAEFLYNGKDCCVTREIFPQIERDAKTMETYKGYRENINRIPSLLRMQIRGVKIDLEKKAQLKTVFQQKAEETMEKLQKIVGTEINPGSPVELHRLLYGYYGLPIQYNHKTGKPTTDKDAINKLLKKTGLRDDQKEAHEVLQAIAEYRKFSKLYSTYATFEVEPDGRVRTSYTWVSTFRLSSSESVFGGGGNLQNIPIRTTEGKEIRKLFIPDEGMVFLSQDQAQAEARVVAWEANDVASIEMFEHGGDIHWARTKMIFNLPDDLPYEPKALVLSKIVGEEWSHKKLRQIGKTVVHASNYGMGPLMLQNILIREEVFLEQATCRALLTQWQKANPAILQWQARIREEIRATRTLVSAVGRRRIFRGRLNDQLFRSAYAYKPQNTVGELQQMIIERIFDELDYYEPLLNVHDETLGQCREEDIPRAIEDIRRIARIPLRINGRELIIPCEFKWGRNWGEMEEIH